jgi:hypothetical protein
LRRANLPFSAKTLREVAVKWITGNDFQRDLLLILIVGALRQVHSAHAASPQQPYDSEPADHLSGGEVRCLQRPSDRFLNLPLEICCAVVGAQHGQDLIPQRRVVVTLREQHAQAGIVIERHSAIEELLQQLPALRCHCSAASLRAIFSL